MFGCDVELSICVVSDSKRCSFFIQLNRQTPRAAEVSVFQTKSFDYLSINNFSTSMKIFVDKLYLWLQKFEWFFCLKTARLFLSSQHFLIQLRLMLVNYNTKPKLTKSLKNWNIFVTLGLKNLNIFKTISRAQSYKTFRRLFRRLTLLTLQS